MPSRTFTINKDTLLAKSGSTALGGGADPHLPVGYYAGYNFHAALKFNTNWTGMTSITSATLHLKTTGQVHVQFGADPDVNCRRLIAAFSENSAKGTSDGGSGWSAAASNYDDIVTTTTGETNTDMTTSENTWDTIDVTDIVRAWAPAFAGGDSQPNYGLVLLPVIGGDSSETIEFYGQESSYDPYITVVYESNTVPNAPTMVSPVGGSVITDLTPDLTFTHSDPQGDPCSSYDLQVSTDGTFASVTHWDLTDQTTGISGSSIVRTYAGTALTRGTVYYWRARTNDGSGDGAWSAAQPFQVNQLPTATKLSPVDGDVAYIHNLASDLSVWTSGGSHAKPRFDWSFDDADSDSQSAYRVRIYDASTGGSMVHDSGQVSSAFRRYDSTFAVVHSTDYWWTVEVWDTNGESSGESSRTRFQVLWGQAIYEDAPAGGSNSSSWDFEAAAPVADTQHAFLFASATGASGAGRSAWTPNIGELTPDAYINILVRLATNASGTQPLLDDMTFSYVGSAAQPDKWVFSSPTGDWRLDPSVRRYGSQSLRCLVSTTSGDRTTYPYRKTSGDDVVVQPSTEYVFSAFVKTAAPLVAGASLRLQVLPGGGGTAIADGGEGDSDSSTTDTSPYPEGWQRLLLAFTTGAGVTRVRPVVSYKHNGTTSGDIFWVDAWKLEEGTVATAWTPGFVGDPVVLDAGGIAIDGLAGGIFRLRGTSGGSRSTVTLGADGLVFGGDIEVSSPALGEVLIDASGSDTDLTLLLNADTGNIANIQFGEEGSYDVNLYRGAANLLVTDDDFEAASLAIGSNKVSRFVPGAFGTVVTSAGTSSDTATTAVEVTGVPSSGVVAVLLRVRLRNTGGTSGSTLAVMHYDGTIAAQVMAPAQNRDANTQAIVGTGGTNNRQFKWSNSLGGQTNTYDIICVGYWTTE